MTKRTTALLLASTLLVGATLTTGIVAAHAYGPGDWGSNLIEDGGFEAGTVTQSPLGWTVIGQLDNPVTVEAAPTIPGQFARIPGRTSPGTSLRGVSWKLPEAMERVKVEFSFAVPDTSARTLEFWTQGEGQTNTVSQITIAYQNGKLEQASNVGGYHREEIGSSLLPSDETSGTLNWYRMRIVAESSSDTITTWLSGPNQSLPAETTAGVEMGTWITNKDIESINFGFSKVQSPSYYLIDDVDVRGSADFAPSAFTGNELIVNRDFAYDASGSAPVGWSAWPAGRASNDFGVSETATATSARTLRIHAPSAASGRVEGVMTSLGQAQERIQVEFTFAFTAHERSLSLWTLGPAERSSVTQINMRTMGNKLQQFDGSWRTIATLATSTDVNGDGELVNGVDTIAWHSMRLVTDRHSGKISVWLADEGQPFTSSPTSVMKSYGNHTSFGAIVFGYSKTQQGGVAHIGDISVAGIADADPTPTTNITRYPIWDGAAGSFSGAGMPVPTGTVVKQIHAPTDATDCTFLHGVAIVEHEGTLYVSWENGPRDENSKGAMMRGISSTDWGDTWSAPEVIAPDPDLDPAYEPCVKQYDSDNEVWRTETGTMARSHGSYLSHNGELMVFVPSYDMADHTARFRGGLHAELWVLDEATGSWSMEDPLIIDNLWPIEPPRQMDDGRWIMGGVDKNYEAVFATSDTTDPKGAWTTTVFPNVIADGSKAQFTETALWVDGSEITALFRSQRSTLEYRAAGVATSHDRGNTWDTGDTYVDIVTGEPETLPMRDSNLPMTPANPFVGTLSTGQRYFIGNISSRKELTIQVSRVGELMLSHTFLITDEVAPPVYPGAAKGPQNNQPYAIEVTVGGEQYLYVVYSDSKENAELAIIPIDSLAVEAPSLAAVALETGLTVNPGDSVTLSPMSTRIDGVELIAELATTVSYYSDQPTLVTFSPDGVMTLAEDVGTLTSIDVWAEVDYGLGPITSPPVAVTIH